MVRRRYLGTRDGWRQEGHGRLTDPVAKRLYRLLDKRFYHSDEVKFDLHELAFHKVRVSEKYNTAQIKRALGNGIRELEALWELRRVPVEKRFIKRERGRWDIVFQRQRPRRLQKDQQRTEAVAADLVMELTRRDIGPAMADQLASNHPAETIQTMVELFDWYRGRGQAKGPGFLVDSIRRAAEYRFPAGFRSNAHRHPPRKAQGLRCQIEQRQTATRREAVSHDEKSRQGRYLEFWNALPGSERPAFEAEALKLAHATKRDGYLRLQAVGGPAFEHYRGLILRDHFERSHCPSVPTAAAR